MNSPALLRAARRDATLFAEFVLRDESTGQPVTLAPMHRGMHKLWDQPRAALWAFAEAGKTSNLTARLAWELGRNPNLRVSIVAGASSQAERVSTATARLLGSPPCRRVFPGLRVAHVRDAAFTVAGRSATAKDPSCTPTGLGQGSSLGQRFDLIVGDDLLDLESTRTPAGREAAWSAFVSVHMSRLAPGGRVWLSGTSWHPDDVLHRAAKLPGWSSERFPVLDAEGKPTWPARWPIERVEQRRLELGPLSFARVMQCAAVDESSLVFDAAAVAAMIAQGATAPSENYSSLGGRLVLGVDVAFSTSAAADESALVLVRTLPDGRREVIDVWAGRWDFDGLCERAIDIAARHKAIVAVESNGGGRFVHEQIRKRVPSVALATTAQSKLARVEWLAGELSAGRWSFRQPLGALSPEQRKLADELIGFSFADHCGDRLAALLVAVQAIRDREAQPPPRVRWFRSDFLSR